MSSLPWRASGKSPHVFIDHQRVDPISVEFPAKTIRFQPKKWCRGNLKNEATYGRSTGSSNRSVFNRFPNETGRQYLPVMKRSKGKSPILMEVYSWENHLQIRSAIFHCHVWVPEGGYTRSTDFQRSGNASNPMPARKTGWKRYFSLDPQKKLKPNWLETEQTFGDFHVFYGGCLTQTIHFSTMT